MQKRGNDFVKLERLKINKLRGLYDYDIFLMKKLI